MWWGLYSQLIWLAAAATGAHALARRAVGYMTLTATALWSYLALTGSDIALYHQDGASTVLAAPTFQYLATGLALINFMAWVLWYFGQYPPAEEDSTATPGEIDPEGRPID
jgi:hypothetical protein